MNVKFQDLQLKICPRVLSFYAMLSANIEPNKRDRTLLRNIICWDKLIIIKHTDLLNFKIPRQVLQSCILQKWLRGIYTRRVNYTVTRF